MSKTKMMQYQSATSGLWYTNAKAAGDVAAIRFNGVIYNAPAAVLGDLLNSIGDELHAIKIAHGWKVTTMDDWGNPDKMLAVLMLITTEVAEAAEAVRNNDIENFKEELADIAMRLISLPCGMGIDLGEAITKKMEYNRTRPYKHGGKRI